MKIPTVALFLLLFVCSCASMYTGPVIDTPCVIGIVEKHTTEDERTQTKAIYVECYNDQVYRLEATRIAPDDYAKERSK